MMKQPSEREIMLIDQMRKINFIDRIESIGSMIPGDDVAELMEWHYLRDDLLQVIQDLKCLPLSELQEKYPISEPGKTVGHVTVSAKTRDMLIERLGLRDDDFEEEFPNDQRGSWYDCADGPDVGR